MGNDFHILTGNSFFEAFSGRSRKGFGPLEAFKFNLELMWTSLEAVEKINCKFRPLIERERRNIVNRAVRSQYELGWASKAFQCPMYFEFVYSPQNNEAIKPVGIMEHSIPVSMLVNLVLDAWPKRRKIASDHCFLASTYYVALMTPVVLVSRTTDRMLSNNGLHKAHPNPSRPLSRYSEVDAEILNFNGQPSNDIALEDHIALVKKTQAGCTYLSDASLQKAIVSFSSLAQ